MSDANAMTDAARLYWKNLDVLEEARGELNRFLSAMWNAFEENRPKESGERKIGSWNDNDFHPPARRNFQLEKPTSWLKVQISDGRKHDDGSEQIDIHISTNKAAVKTIARQQSALVDGIARECQLKWDWDAKGPQLVEQVSIVPSDATATGRAVADRFSDVLHRLLALEAAFEKVIPDLRDSGADELDASETNGA